MKIDLEAQYENIRIRQIDEKDLEGLRVWRNDPVNMAYLSRIGIITPETQREWYNSNLAAHDACTLAIDEIGKTKQGHMVGSLSIYDICKNEAEIGRMMIGAPEAKGRGIGHIALTLALYLGYEKMDIDLFHAEVHEDNMPSRTIFLGVGFEPVGSHNFPSGGKELDLILTRDKFYDTVKLCKSMRLIGA